MADIHHTMHGPLGDTGTVLIKHFNEGTSEPLVIPVTLLCNTDDEIRKNNIRTNSRKPLPWLKQAAAHDRPAIICGSGPSLRDNTDELLTWAKAGAAIIAINGAAKWINQIGIVPTYQIIIDARRENHVLLGDAKHYLLASQCHPDLVDAVDDVTLVHMLWEHLDECLPSYDQDYAVVGAAASAGPVGCFIAYTIGHRNLQLYGFDSSHKTVGDSHAVRQPMNDGEPCAQVHWNGKTYLASLVMKQQAEQFINVRSALQDVGCSVTVHGTGLLPDILATIDGITDEQSKYQAIWCFDKYRTYSPALEVVDQIAEFLPPQIEVLDLGCGTGKAAVALAQRGFKPVLVDFAENCRNPEAMSFPFIKADLSDHIPARASYGYCCDVMEHIPPDQVDTVLHNISTAADNVFFRIETEPDVFGSLIGQRLHLSVHDDAWWRDALLRHWPHVAPKGDGVFICRRYE